MAVFPLGVITTALGTCATVIGVSAVLVAVEWRFIVGWCEEHDAAIEAEWPRHELQRIEAALGAR